MNGVSEVVDLWREGIRRKILGKAERSREIRRAEGVKEPAPIPPVDVSVNWFDLLRLFMYESLKLSTYEMISGTGKGFSMDLPKYIIGFICQWLFKVGGGVLLTFGISESSWTEIVTAAVMFLVGLVVQIFQHNKALNATPPAQR